MSPRAPKPPTPNRPAADRDATQREAPHASDAQATVNLEQELGDCYSLMNELNPPQVRHGGARRLLWLIGELPELTARPAPGLAEEVLQAAEDYKRSKFVEWYLRYSARRRADR